MKNIIPSLSDLSQDIAGPIPLDLIQSWVESDASKEAHEHILEKYKRVGTFVSSDSAGLSKMSAGRPLIEVMRLVSEPKEIIFSHGTAIGGKAVGVWAADNTQMFYDHTIDENEVVSQMIAAQAAINDVLVNVGIGIHTGTAFEIGGGLYGVDADTIEEFTENESEGNEVIVSGAVKAKLRDEFVVKSMRGEMHILDHDAVSVQGKTSENVYYPAPFDRKFHDALLNMDITKRAEVEALHRERVKESTIVLFRVFHKSESLMLNAFLNQVAANTAIHGVTNLYRCKVVKSNGTLAIISCDDAKEAVDLSLALMEMARKNQLLANVGVAKGDVLIFDLGNGSGDLAGGPINLSSKLAEDTDERSVAFFDDSVAEHARQHGVVDSFEIKKSGVLIKGVKK